MEIQKEKEFHPSPLFLFFPLLFIPMFQKISLPKKFAAQWQLMLFKRLQQHKRRRKLGLFLAATDMSTLSTLFAIHS